MHQDQNSISKDVLFKFLGENVRPLRDSNNQSQREQGGEKRREEEEWWWEEEEQEDEKMYD